jgi:hypothetical protein
MKRQMLAKSGDRDLSNNNKVIVIDASAAQLSSKSAATKRKYGAIQFVSDFTESINDAGARKVCILLLEMKQTMARTPQEEAD